MDAPGGVKHAVKIFAGLGPKPPAPANWPKDEGPCSGTGIAEPFILYPAVPASGNTPAVPGGLFGAGVRGAACAVSRHAALNLCLPGYLPASCCPCPQTHTLPFRCPSLPPQKSLAAEFVKSPTARIKFDWFKVAGAACVM